VSTKQNLASGCSKDPDKLTEDGVLAMNAINRSPDKLRSYIEASESPSKKANAQAGENLPKRGTMFKVLLNCFNF
jgi:hypothetical protein